MKKNNNPITIYWSPYYPITQMMSDWSFLYPKPKTLFSELYKNKDKENVGRSFFTCPAFADKLKKTLVIRSATNSSHEYDFTDNKQYLNPITDLCIELQKIRQSSVTFGSTVSYSLNYMFFAEESVEAYFTPPMFHEPRYTKYASAIPGQFNIGEWFRPFNFEVQLWKNKGEIHLEENEPLFYVEFQTDRPVILKRFNVTETLFRYSNASTWSSSIFGLGDSLSKRYERFKNVGYREKILTEIKKNLVDEEPYKF
jgi:hypothetical protein